MEGVLYLTDDNNKKRFIHIDLDKYGDIVEDMLDRFIIAARRDEESIPFEKVTQEFKEKGNLDKYV